MRLPGYDYSLPGYYFFTVCTKHRPEIFGIVRDGQMRLNVLVRQYENAGSIYRIIIIVSSMHSR